MKFAYQYENAEKVFLVQITESNLSNYKLVKETEMLDLIKNEGKISDAFLYAVFDKENLSMEDFIFKHEFLKDHTSS